MKKKILRVIGRNCKLELQKFASHIILSLRMEQLPHKESQTRILEAGVLEDEDEDEDEEEEEGEEEKEKEEEEE